MYYILFSRGTSRGRGGRINFGGSSFDRKSKIRVPFLTVKSDLRTTSPPPPAFPPNASDHKILQLGEGEGDSLVQNFCL